MKLDGSRDVGFLTPARLVIVVVVAVVFSIALEFRGSDTDNATDAAPLHMRGAVTIHDQRTCASGPLLRISAGVRAPVPLEYEAANAPCRLLVNTEIEKATQYTFEVRPLPPIVRTADQIKIPDGSLEIELALYP